jgi:hypothetical protein
MKKIIDEQIGKEVSKRIVWSNGKVIRLYNGQNKSSTWHNPRDGYRKMVAVLYELNEGEKDEIN